MKRIAGGVFIIVLLIFINTGCKKKAYDEFYGRPDSLAQPIYQVLQAKGNFKSLLACIDKAGYKGILSASGYYTLFAPNDEAFAAYLSSSGIGSIDKIDTATAAQIVNYMLVYNAFTKARLGDYQSNNGWVTNSAFRRRTTYYTSYYDDTIPSTGQKVKALASNRNNSFVLGDNNNKYITYFQSSYLASHGLSEADYKYFYPSVAFTGFNVADAAVLNVDIPAENGYIHEVNKVVLPPKSIDQYLASNPNYSEFKKIFDKYLVSFVLNTDATNKYKLVTGKPDNVYIKLFATGVTYSPNNENYVKTQDNDGQADAYSLLAPQNNILKDYISSVLLENYPSLDALPPQIIIDFVNSQMWQTALWPSKFATTNNSQAEPATINATSNVVDRQVLSNGFFYGTNKVHEPNVFRTVYGKSYLDPRYLLMTRALDMNYRYTITLPNVKFTVIMMSDQVMKMRGYDYSTANSAWTYTQPGTSTVTSGNAPRDNVQRILGIHIIPTPNGEMNDLSGSGIIESINGEYIKWNNGKLSTAGTIDSGYTVNVSTGKTAFNGRVWYADNLLTFSARTLGTSIKNLAGTSAASSEFYNFFQFLSNSSLYNATTGDILGVQPGVFYTAFIPNNAAIQAAVNAGLLPTTGVVSGGNKTPNFAPTVQADRDLVNNFILYHILNKTTVVPDGKKPIGGGTATYESLYKKLTGDPGTFKVTNNPGSMSVTDSYLRVANVITAKSNNLADRCVIHLIDNYLQYNPN